jgi:hypothetical protein
MTRLVRPKGNLLYRFVLPTEDSCLQRQGVDGRDKPGRDGGALATAATLPVFVA